MEEYTIKELLLYVKTQCSIVTIAEHLLGNPEEHNERTKWDYTYKTFYKEEKTASFKICSSTNSYHCFSTGKSGDVVTFYHDYQLIKNNEDMDIEKCCNNILEICGIQKINISKKDDTKVFSLKEKEYIDCLKLIIRAGEYLLKSASSAQLARDYLTKRNINKETYEAFSLGYIDEKNFNDILKNKKISIDILREIGLIDENNKYVFCDMLMIPIFNEKNVPISICGRSIYENTDKQFRYRKLPNISENLNPNHYLYGMEMVLANKSLSEGELIIVEGYFDVMRLYQNKIRNVCAIQTTHLTEQQKKQIIDTRFSKVVFMLDADESGQKIQIENAQQLVDFSYHRSHDVLDIMFINDSEYIKSQKDPDEFITEENVQHVLKHRCDYLNDYIETNIKRYEEDNGYSIEHFINDTQYILRKYPLHIERIENIIKNNQNRQKDYPMFETYIDQDNYAKKLFLIQQFQIEFDYANNILEKMNSFEKEFEEYTYYLKEIYKYLNKEFMAPDENVDIYIHSNQKKIYGEPHIFTSVYKKIDNLETKKKIFEVSINYKEKSITFMKRFANSSRKESDFFDYEYINIEDINKKNIKEINKKSINIIDRKNYIIEKLRNFIQGE